MTQNTQNTQNNTQQFRVDKSLIRHLIESQAGTLEKALMENVMNGIDAGASAIDIEIDRDGFTVRDNGHGFQTRKEIDEYFGTFGFDHESEAEAGKRTYGRFGIGRGQQWKFARTTYRTRTFEMDVDIRERGLDYIVTEGLSDSEGTLITGTFYSSLTTVEVVQTRQALEELVRYSFVPITINGKVVSNDPSKEKWTVETDDAWIRLTSSSRGTQLYNFGMFVAELPSSRAGANAIVVSKPGVNLELNMARNDVSETSQAWKRIKTTLRNLTNEKIKRNSRLTESDLRQLTAQIKKGEDFTPDVLEVLQKAKLITDMTGKSQNLNTFCGSLNHRSKLTLYDEKRKNACLYLHQQGLAYVLHPNTLERWQVDKVDDLIEILQAFSEKYSRYFGMYYLNNLDSATIEELTPDFNEKLEAKDLKEYTPQEKVLIHALNRHAYNFESQRMRRTLALENKDTQPLQFAIGISDGVDYWKDNNNMIFIEQDQVRHILANPDNLSRTVMQLGIMSLVSGTYLSNDDGIPPEAIIQYLTEYFPANSLPRDILKYMIEYAVKNDIKMPSSLMNELTRQEKMEKKAEDLN